MKKFISTEEMMNKKIHKLYLFLALFIGIVLSIAMPLFNEPDGQYHYTASTNIAGLSNDLSAYGEISIGTGIDQQIPHYQSGNFFETYLENKIKRMPVDDLPRDAGKSDYDYWGHLVPAAGVWLGHALYPSIGVMVVVARLFTTFVCSLLMFLIIKWVKAGKLLFFALSLSPVITNSFASLSYDATTYVLAAFTIAAAINILVRKKISSIDFLYLVLSSVFLWYGAKTNLKLLIVLIPFVMFMVYTNNGKRLSIENALYAKQRREGGHHSWRGLKIIVSIIGVLCAGGIVFVVKPTMAFAIYRIMISYIINVTPGLTPNSVFQSALSSPYANINYIPFWVSAAWWFLLILILLVEKKYVSSPLVSWFSFILFWAGIGAVYYSFTDYVGGASTVSLARSIGAVQGVQGRYFTPTLLLLSLFAGSEKFKFKLDTYRLVAIFAVVLVIVSNTMLLFGTLFGIYFLS